MLCILLLEAVVSKKPKPKSEPKPEAAKMGRPPVSDDLRRTWRVAVTVNRSELDTISAAAAADDQTVSDWSRDILLKAAEKGAK
jgi:hypothetical protein